MKKGSITVFLSLILVLLFSFLMTTLEAARIRGATAYLSMLSELSGDSFLAAYYYPLFQHYCLFGVDMGEEEGYLSEDMMVKKLKNPIAFGAEEMSGGLLSMQNIRISGLEYKTLLSQEGTSFLEQIKEQVVLNGLSMALTGLFSEEQFEEAGTVGELYRKQEETLAATATVTQELLKLMELVDGVCMGNNGISTDADGKLQRKDAFIKQLAPMEQAELKAAYENKEVFRATAEGFYRPDIAANRIAGLILSVQNYEYRISDTEDNMRGYQKRLQRLKKEYEDEKQRIKEEKITDKEKLNELSERIKETEGLIEAEENAKKDYEQSREIALSEAKVRYRVLSERLEAVETLLKDALKMVSKLETKQLLAKASVESYEAYLESLEPKLSKELYQVFAKELEKMRIYAGLSESGFSLPLIRQSLQTDYDILHDFSLPRFSESEYSVITDELSKIENQMKRYTLDGLWFSYGDIVAAESTFENVTGFLSDFLRSGILPLVGISEEEQSECSLSGVDLPSAGLKKETMIEELMTCIDVLQELFKNGGIGKVLDAAENTALDMTALELYSMKYFHNFLQASPGTKLNYEREYLIFGSEEDKDNLFSAVLYLIAIRTLFCMVMILKQPDRMAKLQSLSLGVVGFTGIPLLASVIKYGALLLWSVEEALVEVTALMQGKCVAVIGQGRVEFEELFLMNRETIEGKAKKMSDNFGADYTDYLTLLSLTVGMKEKMYRMMDLIQENIRVRYRDSFRIKNVVTQVSFQTTAKLVPMFADSIFRKEIYEIRNKKRAAY